MAGMSAAALCAAGSVCIIQALLRDVRGRDPPRLATVCGQLLPLWKVIRWRPHAGELQAGPARARFFLLAAHEALIVLVRHAGISVDE